MSAITYFESFAQDPVVCRFIDVSCLVRKAQMQLFRLFMQNMNCHILIGRIGWDLETN